METRIDARGLACPEPVVLVQRGVAAHPAGVTVVVDAVAARENITRFGNARGYRVEISEDHGEYTLTLSK